MSGSISTFVFYSSLVTWIGTVAFLNVVVIPLLPRVSPHERAIIIGHIFSRAFYFATGVALVVLLSGIGTYMFFAHNRTLETSEIFGLILIGVLAVFHMIVVQRLIPMVKRIRKGIVTELDMVHTFLRIVPRVGFAVLISGSILLFVSS